MQNEVVYLKINPDTIQLKPKQIFHLDECQYCGDDHFHYQRVFSYVKRGQPVIWVVRCDACKKTVGQVNKG